MAQAPKVAESRAKPWSHGFPLRAARTTHPPAWLQRCKHKLLRRQVCSSAAHSATVGCG